MTDLAPAPAVASVSLLDAGRDPEGFSQRLGGSFERYGFAIVSDHGIPADLIARAEEKAKAFFALPEEAKGEYHIPGGGGARGYTPFGIETAKGATAFDLKEFWHVGRELPEGHKYADVMAANIWPSEVPGFKETFLELFAAFDIAGLRILEAIARYLGLAPDYFEDTVSDGNSVLRLLHYPPTPGDGPNVRAGAHEDINTITLLLGAEEAGLQLLDRDGNWLQVTPKPGELAVNIGDMLQRLTNMRMRSTTHRVVNPPPERRGHSRYSMPFFLHFRPDFLIETLPNCVDADHPDRFPEPITAHDYLMERLREIKLA
ncbi:2-oxoglutarate and iron-dependent oxygenase domain-containing protein [Sphingosinicella sp. LHD-64]|uniref:isopenicillin N synthase family dioxygenase n=1 Tax=Sphingosinicella sp. LHD-64 TaxID=3072139 RepID=UPI00280C5ED1|nr:2-oxoglutarate and iron-dependent oxygenase domain-containing protein [Sphingosinicella sp. LHD-64]MDQ8757682.1 2-oxoglutarate and iron-dependent oxygenase domain-containing protein [Sphingosinicella sp. LHD-64]